MVPEAVSREDVVKRMPHDPHPVEQGENDEAPPAPLSSLDSTPGAVSTGGAAAGRRSGGTPPRPRSAGGRRRRAS
eukprot:1884948-Alexandrium_andersonii.AAC.1